MKLVAFSGLDGSGKSTQIELLEDYLREQGQRVNILTMYDDVSISGMSRRWLRGKRKKTKPSTAATVRPVVKSEPSFRLDKNYFSWPRFLGRLLVYSADALVLRMRVSRLRAECDWLICDRFIYDSLVNLFALRNFGWLRPYSRAVMLLAPAPDVACYLDVAPDDAYARKPEYDLEYTRRRGASYDRFMEVVLERPRPVHARGGVQEMFRAVKEKVNELESW
jgi:thymidylate kinase